MKAAKTDTHDWVRLRLDDGTAKAGLTWSRSGDTVSGSLLTTNYKLSQKLAEAWSKYRDVPGKDSLGKKVSTALAAAQQLDTIAAFADWLEDQAYGR